jgi:hypothetical protein
MTSPITSTSDTTRNDLAAIVERDAAVWETPKRPFDQWASQSEKDRRSLLTLVREMAGALDQIATNWEAEANARYSVPNASAASLLAVGIQRNHAQSVRAISRRLSVLDDTTRNDR